MDYSAFTAILCCSFLLASITTSFGEQNTNHDVYERKVLGQRFHRRNAEHTISKRSTSSIVDISMFTDSSAPGKVYSVYVDSTMTRLIIEVKVDRSNPVAILAKPSGLPGPRPSINGTASTGTVTATFDITLKSTDYGIWKLNKLDANTWNAKIQAESSLDFTYQFLSGSFIQVPITGDPVQGETYKTVITVADITLVKSIDLIQMFVFEKVTSANMFPPHNDGKGSYSLDKLTMLDKDFMIGIQGRDTSGKFFRRIKLIKPVALLLSVPSFKDLSVKLYENEKLDLPFYVTNKLTKEQDIDLRIKDTQGLAQSPTIISATLKPGQNFTGKFILNGGLFGVSVDVTITAKPYLGPGKKSDGPSVMRTFTVERNITTTTSSSTTTSTTTPTPTTTPSSPTSSPAITSTSSSTKSTKATQTTKSPSGTTKKGTSNPASSGSSSVSSSASTSKPAGASLTSTNNKLTNAAAVSSKVTAGGSSGSTSAPSANSKSSAMGSSSHSKTTASPGALAKSQASSSSSKTATSAPSSDSKDESYSKGEMFGAAIVSGVSAGVLIGVAALVTMGLVFKHSIDKSKRKVAPDEKKKKKTTLSEDNDLTKPSPNATTPATTSPKFPTPAMVPIISSAPVSTNPEAVLTSTTFVRNPVSAPRASISETVSSSTPPPSSTNPISVDSKPVNSNPDTVTPKDHPSPSSKLPTDKPERDAPTEETDIVKSPDQSDPKFHKYLRLIKDLARNKP